MGGEPLADENIEDVLNLINKIRLLLPDKTIWLYSGCTFEQCIEHAIRKEIVSKCDILVDGRYIDSQRDTTLFWRGSANQRVIDVKKSLKENKVMLYAE